MHRWGRGEGGQSLVELALLLPVLVFGLIGAADMARAYSAQIAIQNAARAGAEARVMEIASSDTAVTAYVQDELTGVAGIDPSAASVSVTNSTVGGVDYVTVGVRYSWRTLVAWPLVPNSAQFDRSVTMRKCTTTVSGSTYVCK
jgi:Flp pilus assembly protein TadG